MIVAASLVAWLVILIGWSFGLIIAGGIRARRVSRRADQESWEQRGYSAAFYRAHIRR